MSALGYALLCVIAPAAWGLIMAFVYGRIDRRTRAPEPPEPAATVPAPPADRC